MEDLSLHILDIAENSVRVGARTIVIRMIEDAGSGELILDIEDDGKGMDPKTLERVLDPFFTTKESGRTGLGLPLLAQSAQETGGGLKVDSEPGKGTRVHAVFRSGHPDMRPVGDLGGTLKALIAGNPGTRFICEYSVDGTEYRFDSEKNN